MPELVSSLRLPMIQFYASDNKGREFGVAVVKATFTIELDGRLSLAEEQAAMIFTDKCHGAVNVSSLWHPSDLVAVKPTADILLNAVARAPGGKPVSSWPCGVAVSGPDGVLAESRLRVTGPRWWQPRWRRTLNADEKRTWWRCRKDFSGWVLSDPEPVLEVPLRYEFAYGGTVQTSTGEDGPAQWACETRNPIGRGLIDPKGSDHTEAQPAPQIESAAEPISDPHRCYAPRNLGPIPPAWDPRLPKGGTYDQHWRETVWPNWPADYDFAYNNSAHPDLICPRHLRPGDRVVLDNLLQDQPRVTITIPGMTPQIRPVSDTDEGPGDDRDMDLDTCFLDIAGRRQDCRVFLSWRATYDMDAEKVLIFSKRERNIVEAG